MPLELLISEYNDMTLNIGRIIRQSKVNGPGVRFTLWLQGCPLRCKGCINKAFWSNKPNQLIKVSDLHNMILNTPDIEGVTYSGGEPFEQSEGLHKLSLLLKDNGLSIMAYSGYTYQEIINCGDEFKKDLLNTLDILVDGRYEEERRAPLLWRGSNNQRVHFLTLLYKDYERVVEQQKMQMEFSINPETNKISMTGNFSHEMVEEIQKRMKAYGINI